MCDDFDGFSMITFDTERSERLALTSFADSLWVFMKNRVRLPRSITRDEVVAAVLALHKSAVAVGFDSEVDLSLYVVAWFCFPDRAADGSLELRIADTTTSVDEKRYRLSVELDQASLLPFGSLESDDPE